MRRWKAMQYAGNIFGAQLPTRMDREALAGEHIHYREGAESLPLARRVGYKIHAPGVRLASKRPLRVAYMTIMADFF